MRTLSRLLNHSSTFISILRLILWDTSCLVVFGAHWCIWRCLKSKLHLIQWNVRLLGLFKVVEYFFGRLIDGLAAIVKLLFVCRAFLSENLEAKDKWLVGERTILRVEVRVSLEKNVGKTDAEVSSIDIQVLLTGYVHFLATWAVDFDTRCW